MATEIKPPNPAEPEWTPQPPPGHPPDPTGRHPLEDIDENEEAPAYDPEGATAFVGQIAEATCTRV